jgi:RNA polymerase sigma-70 factor, ECF subfamily
MTPIEERGDTAEEDQLHFERCFRDHYADLLAFALRRVAERQAAEDVAAETFAVVWRRRELIPEPPLPWLYAIALHVIANQRRSGRRRRNLELRLAGEVAAGPLPFDPIEALDRRAAFASAFRRLNDDEQEVLRLIAWDGLDPRDAAGVLGCSYGALRVRLHRARRRLAKHLAATGHFPDEPRPSASDPIEEMQ